MNKAILMTAALASLSLAACNKSPSDKLADRVQNAADMRADNIEAQANNLQAQSDMLDNRADAVRKEGDQRADAIQAADRNVQAMSQRQRDAIVANQAAAVR